LKNKVVLVSFIFSTRKQFLRDSSDTFKKVIGHMVFIKVNGVESNIEIDLTNNMFRIGRISEEMKY
jgi:hypothetical protein|tara:strand:+ start:1156 stop:1353 length:198 start_codon:yes stop_codon:yes gene_type:complete